MKKKLPYLLPSFIFFLGAPIVWILCFREVPLKISPETTYLTEPKTVDGKSIDYFAAIKDRFELKCKPEENGFRRVVAGLGRVSYFDDPPNWYWESLCMALDLDPKLTPTVKFEPAKEFFKREYLIWLDSNSSTDDEATEIGAAGKMPDEPTDTEILGDRLKNRPWTAGQHPYMVRWIEENSPVLDLVADALRQEHYFVPLLREPAFEGKSWCPRAFHSSVTFPREIEEAFFYRLQFRLGKDDIDGAWQDAVSISRKRIFQKCGLGYGPDHFSSPMERVLRNRSLTEEQRKRFLADFDALPKRETAKEIFQRWRINAIWNIAIYPIIFEGRSDFKSLNWSLIAAETNRAFDLLEKTRNQIQQEPDATERKRIVDAVKIRLTTKPERSALGKWLGKPVTVDGRSLEFAWLNNQMSVPNLLHVLLDETETSLKELRKKIEQK